MQGPQWVGQRTQQTGPRDDTGSHWGRNSVEWAGPDVKGQPLQACPQIGGGPTCCCREHGGERGGVLVTSVLLNFPLEYGHGPLLSYKKSREGEG